MITHRCNRRHFLKQSGLLTGSALIFPFGCKEAVPKDIRITRIVQFELSGKRPKFVGKNSRKGWSTLVADGESQNEAAAFAPFLEAKCIDILQGDMNRFGIEGILAEAALAALHGAMVAPHNWGSILGYYTQLHLGKVIPNWYRAEHDPLSTPALTPVGFTIEDGYTTVTEAPGLGLKINDAGFEKEVKIIVDLKA